MAEGGGEDNDQNPFSFKKFVESSSVKSDTDESADEKIDEVSKSELPDISNGMVFLVIENFQQAPAKPKT